MEKSQCGGSHVGIGVRNAKKVSRAFPKLRCEFRGRNSSLRRGGCENPNFQINTNNYEMLFLIYFYSFGMIKRLNKIYGKFSEFLGFLSLLFSLFSVNCQNR